ncbi:Aldo-ket-red domain-containing protein [Fusarium sp. LHS14.1]|nr:Aldo-ket-red domain-containing protein [Fusarium sp. LHS14.1]
MAVAKNREAAAAHINMMTDTIIANLPVDGLRVVMRSLLASCPEVTGTFEHETRRFLRHTAATSAGTKIDTADLGELKQAQHIVRCMLGSGIPFQSIPLLKDMVTRGADLTLNSSVGSELESFLASVDSDIVQTMTAVKKTLFTKTGVRAMSTTEYAHIETLFESLIRCQGILQSTGKEYPYGRGLVSTASTLGIPPPAAHVASNGKGRQHPLPRKAKETFVLGDRTLPRIFSGLWQMSSAAWGSAPTSRIVEQFSTHVQNGFTAFDMADHYGDAEEIFGRFRSMYPHKDAIFTATKYCIFHHVDITREAVQANVSERCQRLQQEKIDLLQFHWQFWDDSGYLDALRYLMEDERVGMIGLCNFNTEHLLRTIESGVHVHTNQVQFSLIDSRPTERMGEVCQRHGVKLLTYGTLCGGFLAEKWLAKPEPDVYSSFITPSQRKYYGIICSWGGWELFQQLLRVLDGIAKKHGVNVSNVATRWVLDFPYVGAVIIGARMGVSEHTNDNQATFGWSLDDEDRAAIEQVLEKSNRKEVFYTTGDCGGEYRTIG